MAKGSNRLQMTVPNGSADQLGLHPEDEIEILHAREQTKLDVENRLKRFDQATQRQREREKRVKFASVEDRGWKREDLYDRGRPD